MDVDFVTEKDAHQRLLSLVRTDPAVKAALHSKRLFVLPAFGSAHGAHSLFIPETKAVACNMEGETRSVSPFEIDVWPPSHIPTNYSLWCSGNTGNFYDVSYKPDFEPYVLAYRHGLPRYWEGFRGYYYDKLSFFAEAHALSYKFSVLRDFFVYHVGEAGNGLRKKVPPPTRKKKEEWAAFQKHVLDVHGVRVRLFSSEQAGLDD
jgi:hypothetical protein